MATCLAGGRVYLDDDLPFGAARIQPHGYADYLRVYLHPRTYRTIVFEQGTLMALMDEVKRLGVGEFQLFAPDDTQANLDLLAEQDWSEADSEWLTCVMPGCLQDPVDNSRGFHLCAVHSGVMEDWDLLAS